jgi:multicomponent Na+:H+ antiporter subunit C
MEILVALLIGTLFSISIYLLLSGNLLRMIIGTGLLSHGTHLFLLTTGGLYQGAPPILKEDVTNYVDPLPQALILTAIVIGFGVTAFLVVLGYRTFQDLGSDQMGNLKGGQDD